jgi:integrase
LSWSEQDKLFKQLAQHLANAALFAVNTGCREQEICQLRWEWDVPISDLDISVFVLPESLTKTKTERVVVLNSIAQNVIKSQRGIHPKFVFVFKGKPKKKIRASGWRRAWVESGLPNSSGPLKGVHNLRHTFGRRLRAASIPLETRKVLLGHSDGDITTHYSAAELDELLQAVEKITDREIAQTPTLSLVGRTRQKGDVVKV